MENNISELTLSKQDMAREIAEIAEGFKGKLTKLRDVDATITGMRTAIKNDEFPNRELVDDVEHAYNAIIKTNPPGVQITEMRAHMHDLERELSRQEEALAPAVAEMVATTLKANGVSENLADIVEGSIEVTKQAISGNSPIGNNFAHYFDAGNMYGPTVADLKDRIAIRLSEHYSFKYPISGNFNPIPIIDAACDPQDIKYDAMRQPQERTHFDRKKGWIRTTWKCAVEERRNNIPFVTSGLGKKAWEEKMTMLLGADPEIKRGIKHIQFNFSKARLPEKIIREIAHAKPDFKIENNPNFEKLVAELSTCVYDGKIIVDESPAHLRKVIPKKADRDALFETTAFVNNLFNRTIDEGHDIGATTYATLHDLSRLVYDITDH